MNIKNRNEMGVNINLIAAVALDGSIGYNGKLLWKIKEDLAYYKAKTLGNVIVMGRKTFETLPKVALKGRKHIVISNEIPSEVPKNVTYVSKPVHALKMALKIAGNDNCDVYVAGGGQIYRELYHFCDYAYITWVKRLYGDSADTKFPVGEFMGRFNMVSSSDLEGLDTDLQYAFVTYKNND